MSTSISVVVTSYRRPESLARCLDGLRSQTRPATEVIVVVHDSDADTAASVQERARDWGELRAVTVHRAGSVAALNRGLASARGEIVAFIDDDAIPTHDWLSRLVVTFDRDELVAAVGGRDVIHSNGRIRGLEDQGILWRHRDTPRVGLIQWFGRQIGNHHIGAGGARDVDVLKGVNMSFRRAAIGHGFDERLRGRGAQVHSELSICLPLRRRGFRVVYDPAIVVDHYPAPRPRGDDRVLFCREALRDSAHNEALQVLDHLEPWRRVVFTAWGVGIGTGEAPGIANLARLALTRTPQSLPRFVAAQRGRLEAWRTHRTPRPSPQR